VSSRVHSLPRVAALVAAALVAGALLLWLAGAARPGGGRGGTLATLPGALYVVEQSLQAARAVPSRSSTSIGDLTVRLAPELAAFGTQFLVDITRAGYCCAWEWALVVCGVSHVRSITVPVSGAAAFCAEAHPWPRSTRWPLSGASTLRSSSARAAG
jgi:hypothetical protein